MAASLGAMEGVRRKRSLNHVAQAGQRPRILKVALRAVQAGSRASSQGCQKEAGPSKKPRAKLCAASNLLLHSGMGLKGTAGGPAIGKRGDKDPNRQLGMDGAKVGINGNTGKARDKNQEEEIKLLGELLAKSGKVVAFTGAGVSAESGVPTYRDPGGLWRKYDMKKVSHVRSFLRDPVACWRFELELYRLLKDIRPNAGHFALAEMEAMGVVTGVVTQNVEGLHTRAGSRNVVELHGNETRALCLRCGKTCTAVEAFRRVGWLNDKGEIQDDVLPDVSKILRKHHSCASSSSSSSPSPPLMRRSELQEPSPNVAVPVGTRVAKCAQRTIPRQRSGSPGAKSTASTNSSSSSSTLPDPLPKGQQSPSVPPGAPSCPHCEEGLLKPDATYFGEKLDSTTLKCAEKLSREGQVALVIGTSCQVAPASELPRIIRKRGGFLVDVNPQGSRLSPLADVWLQGPSAEVLPLVARAVAEAMKRCPATCPCEDATVGSGHSDVDASSTGSMRH